MILVTGAGGKTGKSIIAQLVQRGDLVRGFVRSQKSALEITELGAKQAVIGDMLALGDVINAMDGIQSVYHICPNVHPQERLIGKNIITAALHHSAEHLVYHSVLHPQIESMPHHWEKMRVEEMIFASGLNFTILQPTAYMQNILGQKEAILQDDLYRVPYNTDVQFSLVDLNNVAEIASIVLGNPHHFNAIYELCGSEIITPEVIAGALSKTANKKIKAEKVSLEMWESNAINAGLPEYQRSTLIQMFKYYDAYNLVGSAFVTEKLLGHPPTSLAEFLSRDFN